MPVSLRIVTIITSIFLFACWYHKRTQQNDAVLHPAIVSETHAPVFDDNKIHYTQKLPLGSGDKHALDILKGADHVRAAAKIDAIRSANSE